MTDSQQEQSLEWASKLPESIRGSKLVLDSKTEENFWKRIQDQQQYLGNSIQIPSPEASKEQWEEFSQKIKTRVPNLLSVPTEDSEDAYLEMFNKLGRPDAHDKYDVKSIENFIIPEGELAMLKKTAHESGLTQRQFIKLANKLNASHVENMATMGTNVAAEQKSLRTEWGEATDQRLEVVANFMQDSGAPEHAIAAFKAGRLPAQQVKWIYQMASRMGEGNPLASAGSQAAGGGDKSALTPYEANMRLEEIYANRDHPYHHTGRTGYKEAVDQVMRLVRMANP